MNSNNSNNSTTNQLLFKQAKAHIPGGVNSPVRAFAGVGVHLSLSAVPVAAKCMIPKANPT